MNEFNLKFAILGRCPNIKHKIFSSEGSRRYVQGDKVKKNIKIENPEFVEFGEFKLITKEKD